MPQALWKGAIYVPVELHTASKENKFPLHIFDSRDFAPVEYHRVNKGPARRSLGLTSSKVTNMKGQFCRLVWRSSAPWRGERFILALERLAENQVAVLWSFGA